MSKPELEKMFEVWCDDWHYEIGPDRDGLGCIEIRYYDGLNDKASNRMTFGKEEASMITKAITELLTNDKEV